jgi:ribosomal-protein-alanine N-acetyltransferase
VEVEGTLVRIRPLRLSDAPALLDLRVRNREAFAPFFPRQSGFFFTLEGQEREIERGNLEWQSDEGYVFGIFVQDEGALVGNVVLRNVARGAWQNATLGYWVDEARRGRGYATEAVRLALILAFGPIGLHRVQAGTLLHNEASMQVLKKVGFRFEGVSERYLQIDGRWEDHNMYAITVEEWEAADDHVHNESDTSR